MSSNVRWAPGVKVLGFAGALLTDATETNFDFGTPNDIDLATNANYAPGDRVVVVCMGKAQAAQTTDAVTWAIYDADDNAGSIGTPAAASISVIDGALVGAVTIDSLIAAVQVKNGRPWIRVSADMQGTTDDYHVLCYVLAVPSNA